MWRILPAFQSCFEICLKQARIYQNVGAMTAGIFMLKDCFELSKHTELWNIGPLFQQVSQSVRSDCPMIPIFNYMISLSPYNKVPTHKPSAACGRPVVMAVTQLAECSSTAKPHLRSC